MSDPFVDPWKRLHEGGYFARHPHYTNWKLDGDCVLATLRAELNLSADDDVLDVGCGYGRIMRALAAHVHTIHGIDVHRDPLRKAEEILAPLDNWYLSVSDGRTIPYPDATFSLVYSISTMQHVPDEIARGYIAETMRVLRPGGRCHHEFSDAGVNGPAGENGITPDLVREQTQFRSPDQVFALASGIPGSFGVTIYGPDCGPRTVALVGRV